MFIYLDNSATTKPLDSVVTAVAQGMQENYGNPSSLHNLGMQSEKQVKSARAVLASAFNAQPNEVYFTSGATESTNLALTGALTAAHGKGRLITTVTEHKATLETAAYLKKQGHTVEYLTVDSNGLIDMGELEKLLEQPATMVSLAHVNNESGAVQDLAGVRRVINAKAPKCLLHVDAVQSFCKIPIPKNCADLISVSAHKIHGPKGVGALCVKKGVRLNPVIFGGGQENGLRSGTENTYGIFGFAQAVKEMQGNMSEHLSRVQKLRDALLYRLEGMEEVYINSPASGSPYILNFSVMGVRSEIMLHALEQQGVYVSSGSACASNRPAPSHVLLAMGLSRERVDSSLRVSFSPFNTEQEVQSAAEIIDGVIKNIRKSIGHLR